MNPIFIHLNFNTQRYKSLKEYGIFTNLNNIYITVTYDYKDVINVRIEMFKE